MSSAMELRAEMVDRQRSGSEADEMRDRKRRQSTAYQHDAMRERGLSGAALDEVEEEAPAATDVEGESATPEDSLDAIDGKRTKTFMDPAKKQIITDVVDAQIVDQAYAQVRAAPWYILRPMSRLMSGWDVVTTLALLFTAAVTPYEVTFLGSYPQGDRTASTPSSARSSASARASTAQ